MIVAAAIELSGMLFFAGRADEGAAILHRAQQRLPVPTGSAREQLEVALLGAIYTSASARRAGETTIAALTDPGRPARSVLEATTLAALAMDELMYLRSSTLAADRAHRALAAGLPPEPQRGEAWAIVALAVLAATDELDAALRGADEIVARARELGAAAAVATILALRAFIGVRRGDLVAAQADAQASMELAPDMLGTEFVVLAVSAAVLAGLERDETPESLRRLVEGAGVRYDTEFSPSSQLRYASALLRAAAGNPERAIDELLACGADHPALGALNPAVLPWRSAAALMLAEVGRHEEARALAADELRRAEAFGAPRAIAVALRATALVGPGSERAGAPQAGARAAGAGPRRGSSRRGCSSTSAPPTAPPGSGRRRARRCSTDWPSRRAAARWRWSAGRARSWRRSASGRAPPTAPERRR